MRTQRMSRTLSVLACAALIVGAFTAAPADAKKKRKPKAPACPAYTPGDAGKDAETTVVTDAATAEAPVVFEATAARGLGAVLAYNQTSSIYHNIQVDTAGPSAGLYVRFEFPEYHDYDLYLNYAEGGTAASSGDFNTAPGHDLGSGSPEGAWEAGTDYEMVMGINTADCAGYTARLVSFLTTGGAVKLSMWLGDVVAEPNPPS